jgi:hypothetical protein
VGVQHCHGPVGGGVGGCDQVIDECMGTSPVGDGHEH